METRSVATILGGSGFLGRYVTKRLAAAGHVVRVAVRDPERAAALKPMGRVGQIVPLYANITSDGTLARAIDGADVVVNLVGILAERAAGDFSRIQAEGAGRVARLAAAAGVTRLVQVSAIGAIAASPAQYARNKAEGEALVRRHFPARPCCGHRWCSGRRTSSSTASRALAMMSPIMPVIAGASRFQPVYVGDVADAVMAVLTLPASVRQPSTNWAARRS